MDADDLLLVELAKAGVGSPRELAADQAVALGLKFAIWLPISTFTESPWLAPHAIRKIRIRTDPNAPGDARDLWGFPDEHGRFTDDNSLIKAVVRGRQVAGGWSPYGDRRLTTGLVCCHVWPGTTSDPRLFSFVPNLVWLPRSLAGLSDAHYKHQGVHALHFALRAASVKRFCGIAPSVGKEQVDDAWSQLPAAAPFDIPLPEPAEVRGGDAISVAANRRTRRVIDFLSELCDDRLPSRRVSKRYHAGVGSRIDASLPPIQAFVNREALQGLRDDLLRRIH